jgi:hypothetical protein
MDFLFPPLKSQSSVLAHPLQCKEHPWTHITKRKPGPCILLKDT